MVRHRAAHGAGMAGRACSGGPGLSWGLSPPAWAAGPGVGTRGGRTLEPDNGVVSIGAVWCPSVGTAPGLPQHHRSHSCPSHTPAEPLRGQACIHLWLWQWPTLSHSLPVTDGSAAWAGWYRRSVAMEGAWRTPWLSSCAPGTGAAPGAGSTWAPVGADGGSWVLHHGHSPGPARRTSRHRSRSSRHRHRGPAPTGAARAEPAPRREAKYLTVQIGGRIDSAAAGGGS